MNNPFKSPVSAVQKTINPTQKSIFSIENKNLSRINPNSKIVLQKSKLIREKPKIFKTIHTERGKLSFKHNLKWGPEVPNKVYDILRLKIRSQSKRIFKKANNYIDDSKIKLEKMNNKIDDLKYFLTCERL